MLCDNLGDADYDLDGDGDADEDDLTVLVETLVELQDGSGRVGTKRGDFNLDGLVNATDLAVMQSHFGTWPRGWAHGNANCDDIVNATDLAIVEANFGYVAPAGAVVPEPVTMSLLAAGGVALLKRRT
ncbi:MAG: dockerin type I domain-containing protein [Planctomycetota bacterium]